VVEQVDLELADHKVVVVEVVDLELHFQVEQN
jgi:hypothetical protein